MLSLKKIISLTAITTALMLSACSKDEKPAPAAVTTVAPATATTPNTPVATPTTATTYGANDFKTDGLTITEGTDYRKVNTPQPLQVQGKIEVIEFFWYQCPHCYRMEPMVQAWKKTLGKDVNFIRIPASWGAPMDEHQKIFYALNALKKNDDIDAKIFHAMHEEGQGLAKPDMVSAFMVKNGIAKADWDAAHDSFSVTTDIAKANALFKAYELKGVPNFVINGKFIAAPELTGETPKTLQVVNKLIEMERGAKK